MACRLGVGAGEGTVEEWGDAGGGVVGGEWGCIGSVMVRPCGWKDGVASFGGRCPRAEGGVRECEGCCKRRNRAALFSNESELHDEDPCFPSSSHRLARH